MTQDGHSGESEPTLHRCAPTASPAAAGTLVPRLPWAAIDIHCHLFTPSVEKTVAGHPQKLAESAASIESMGSESATVNANMFASLIGKLTDVRQRLLDMDAMGVDIQAISPSPTQYYSWAEPDLADQIAAQQNDAIEEACSTDPQRLVGLGAVSLQHPERAAEQLEALVLKRGFKGVEISSLVNGADIDQRRFDPFWAKADELGVVVFIHPWGTTLRARLSSYYLMNTIGQPFETTVCLSKLIFGGVLDRHRKLRIIAAHGGGYLPLYMGRSDHAYAVRAEAGGCECRPSDYLKRIWFDSVVHDPDGLARLIDQVGVSQVVLGTDYPFDMGHYDPGALLKSFDEDTQKRVLGANAAQLLGIPVPIRLHRANVA